MERLFSSFDRRRGIGALGERLGGQRRDSFRRSGEESRNILKMRWLVHIDRG